MEIYGKMISGQRVVVAGYTSEINKIFSELRAEFKSVRCFRGKDNLWPHNKNCGFPKITYSQARAELVQLMASGIYQFWKYWIRDRPSIESKLKLESTAPPDRLSLQSNVTFVFLTGSFGLATALSVILAERFFHCFT